MKILKILEFSMMKIEAMNSRQWDDSACEMHVKHSMNEEYKNGSSESSQNGMIYA